MDQSKYLELMGIDQWRLRQPLDDSNVVSEVEQSQQSVKKETTASEPESAVSSQPEVKAESTLKQTALNQSAPQSTSSNTEQKVETADSSVNDTSNNTPAPAAKLVSKTVDRQALRKEEAKAKFPACPLCFSPNGDVTNHLVVSESNNGRWYWLIEGEALPLLHDIIKASKTHRLEGNKQLNCTDFEENCKNIISARMGYDDILLIVGTKLARLVLEQAKPFDFEANPGQQAGKLWQFVGSVAVVLPSLQSMHDDRRHKKQAWLNIQQVMSD